MTQLCVCITLLLTVGCSQLDSRHDADLCRLDGVTRSEIFEQVSRGSRQNLRKTVASLACLDGGDLEDAHIAIGMGFFRFPARFAPQLSGQITQNDLRSISTMLPATFVDESCKAIDELLRREKVVRQTNQLGDLKLPMLEALEESRQLEKRRCGARTD